MTYAIVQSTLDKPSVDSLRAAFRMVSWLTDMDAAILARDAYGVIVDNLSLPRAQEVSGALQSSGVSHKMIDQRELPELGMCRQLRRMDCTPEGPVIYDPIGRPIPGQWSDVRLVAAGLVGMREVQRKVKRRIVHRGTGWGGGGVPVVVSDISEKEMRVKKTVMELYMGEAFQRFRVTGDRFQYNYLGDRLQGSSVRNFTRLVQDIAGYAPQAVFSQGVESLVDDQQTTFEYPSEHAFTEEITWLLWMAGEK